MYGEQNVSRVFRLQNFGLKSKKYKTQLKSSHASNSARCFKI